jgi:hypothetical protein
VLLNVCNPSTLGRNDGCKFQRSLGLIAARRFKSAAPLLGNAIAAGEKRLSHACVVEKNEAWWKLGQYGCLKFRCETGIGIATKVRRLAPRRYQAKTFSKARER